MATRPTASRMPIPIHTSHMTTLKKAPAQPPTKPASTINTTADAPIDLSRTPPSTSHTNKAQNSKRKLDNSPSITAHPTKFHLLHTDQPAPDTATPTNTHTDAQSNTLNQSDTEPKDIELHTNSTMETAQIAQMDTTSQLNEETSDQIIYMTFCNPELNIITTARQQPKKFSDALHQICGPVENVKFIPRTKSILITCNTEQKAQLLNATQLRDTPIKCTLPRQRVQTDETTSGSTDAHAQTDLTRTYRCVIHNVPNTLTDGQILTHTQATSFRRLPVLDSSTNSRTAGTTVVLTYNCTPPDTVSIFYTLYKTTTYIPNPIRCNNCQKFGHTTKTCKTQNPTCSYCAQSHNYSACPHAQTRDQPPKCANCNGEHSAAYTQCPHYVRIKQALQIRSTDHITLKEALTRVNPSQTESDHTHESATQHSTHTQVATRDTPALTRSYAQAVGGTSASAITSQLQSDTITLQNTVKKQSEQIDALTQKLDNLQNEYLRKLETQLNHLEEKTNSYQDTIIDKITTLFETKQQAFQNQMTTIVLNHLANYETKNNERYTAIDAHLIQLVQHIKTETQPKTKSANNANRS